MTPDQFCLRLEKDCAVVPGAHVLVAVSGGADSTALLCFFEQARSRYPLSLSCAHVEHGIRGGESLEDLAFVRALCEKMGVPFYASSVDAPGYARAHGCGLEDAARTLRYDFLHKTADAIGADVIALAHHRGDQAETVLLHAARGSDLRGLCAMRMRSGRLIRPLLDCAAGELRAYLESVGQRWREDASNADAEYARNRIRRDALPAIEAAVPGARNALCRLARAAQRDEDYFERALDGLKLHMVSLIDGVAAKKAELSTLHPALLSRMIVRLVRMADIPAQSARVISEIMGVLAEENTIVNLAGDAHAAIGREYLCLTRAERPEIDVPLRVPGVTHTPFGVFEVRIAGNSETGNGKTAQRIPGRILEGARVTGRREGDAMIPFGKRTPVKLKKLMIDAGVERAMRASVPVIRKEEQVLFAVGLRPGECCRGSEQEEQMIVRFGGAWPRAGEETDMQEDYRHD